MNQISPQVIQGRTIIGEYVRRLPKGPGVYRMLGVDGAVLYVGKASNLKNRVTNYTQVNRLPLRLQRMVSQTVSMDFILTSSELEALLLESNLIKKWKPPFNILLKDDKSYSYITLTDHPFPQVMKHRGVRKKGQSYYGPFVSAYAIDQTLSLLQRVFHLRNCTNAYFSNRTRPCLQFHIKQCSAPCVGLIDEKSYAEQVKRAEKLLCGDRSQVHTLLSEEMQAASESQAYERAARVRDQLKALSHVQAKQMIHVPNIINVDIIALEVAGGHASVQIFVYRNGSHYGNIAHVVPLPEDIPAETFLCAFILQHYQDHEPPEMIFLSQEVNEENLLRQALHALRKGTVKLEIPKRGNKVKLVAMACHNAKDALERYLAKKATTRDLLGKIQQLLSLDSPPLRIEIYDNSHLGGTHAGGVMVVATPDGFDKKSYRRFTMKNADLIPGDDYAMMREVMQRRFTGSTHEKGASLPDLLLIDGGKGQVSAVMGVLQDVGLGHMKVLGVAKGPDRNAGRETFVKPDKTTFQLPENDPVLFYIQRLRDEAHRFALAGNRQKRQKDVRQSILDTLPGVGPIRKKALLHFFGSPRAIKQAGVDDLARVPGISRALAQDIYDSLR
ncbi:MAG: excinuclease ABC subunit UvrC [Alphaproteobacteria bacterium]|nr:MAG: excinuclease ABC subunit UvrC [Alphaproteobacteria bacterium]